MTEPRCRSGCPWPNHDKSGACYRGVCNCPETRACEGPIGKDLFEPKPRELFPARTTR